MKINKVQEKVQKGIKKNPFLYLIIFIGGGILLGLIISAIVKVLIPIALATLFFFLYAKTRGKEVKIK